MKKCVGIFFFLFLINKTFAITGQEYMSRFLTYIHWSENLPVTPTPEFMDFIQSNTPLAQKLRDKWLYQLARNKDWASFHKNYRPSHDVNLQCYGLLAKYWQGKVTEVVKQTKPLWLVGYSQPYACNELFTLLLRNKLLNPQLISQRIEIALENRNVSLARYLFQQFTPIKANEIKLLNTIFEKPLTIVHLKPGPFHGDFYVYGLKRLAAINIDKAVTLWNLPFTKQLLNNKQQQSFLAYIALAKALKNHKDALVWFAKVQPAFYDATLLEWRIRESLKTQQWKQVEQLISYKQDKEEPAWQYWLARAKEGQGKQQEANKIFAHIASIRNYYGFLASLHLKQKLSFESEAPLNNPQRLLPYQQFINQIKSLYLSNHMVEASRLLNEFFLELPKEDKGALAHWLMNDLKWYGKALNMSNTDELNNQLTLRFPLVFHNEVSQNSKNFNIPKELIYAIIRQESTFRADIISPAGAHGLMQLMPLTAKLIAKQERIDFSHPRQLFTAQKNIALGTAYLKNLAQRFNHPVLMSAAYNAGPRQVVYWVKNHPPKPMDIWIETLPWKETRNYVKNIIAFYAVYQYRMQQKPDLSAFLRPVH